MEIVELQEDGHGEFFIELPQDIVDSLGWLEGDCLEWSMRGDALMLSRIGEGADIIEDSLY